MIEFARPHDARAIAEIARDTWLATYPNDQLGISYEEVRRNLEGPSGELTAVRTAELARSIERIEEIPNPRYRILVQRVGESVVGYSIPRLLADERRVGALYVQSEFQGQGHGAAVLEAALNWLDPNFDVHLRVATYNTRAIDFYKNHGFVPTGRQFTAEDAQAEIGLPIPELEMVHHPQRRSASTE